MANVTQLLEASAMTLEHTDHKKALQSNPDIIRTDLPEKYLAILYYEFSLPINISFFNSLCPWFGEGVYEGG